MKKEIKSFFIGVHYLLMKFIMWIPINFIRTLYTKLILKNQGNNVSFLRFVEFKKPQNISIGAGSVVNQRVLLDGRGGELRIGSNVDIAQEAIIWTLEHDVNSDTHTLQLGTQSL